jgi:hypothetical protein
VKGMRGRRPPPRGRLRLTDWRQRGAGLGTASAGASGSFASAGRGAGSWPPLASCSLRCSSRACCTSWLSCRRTPQSAAQILVRLLDDERAEAALPRPLQLLGLLALVLLALLRRPGVELSCCDFRPDQQTAWQVPKSSAKATPMIHRMSPPMAVPCPPARVGALRHMIDSTMAPAPSARATSARRRPRWGSTPGRCRGRRGCRRRARGRPGRVVPCAVGASAAARRPWACRRWAGSWGMPPGGGACGGTGRSSRDVVLAMCLTSLAIFKAGRHEAGTPKARIVPPNPPLARSDAESCCSSAPTNGRGPLLISSSVSVRSAAR